MTESSKRRDVLGELRNFIDGIVPGDFKCSSIEVFDQKTLLSISMIGPIKRGGFIFDVPLDKTFGTYEYLGVPIDDILCKIEEVLNKKFPQ